ncbi:uncharacterized protein [Asterias amurensis]|uniref:uncharacterized protein n=1 Tax=Asterias amurensis TaxID=7602 RepID=UPI003AB268CF
MLLAMAPNGEMMTRFLLAAHCLLLAVSIVNARVYFNGEDETKSGLLELSEYGENEKVDGTEDVDRQQVEDRQWKGEDQWKSGLYAAQHSLQSYPNTAKSSWPQTGMYNKQSTNWLRALAQEPRWHSAMAKRQLWANQQSGLFGKREADMERTLPAWNVKRSAEEREFARQSRGGGVPHVFQSGGIFGKRSSDDWAKRYE